MYIRNRREDSLACLRLVLFGRARKSVGDTGRDVYKEKKETSNTKGKLPIIHMCASVVLFRSSLLAQ